MPEDSLSSTPSPAFIVCRLFENGHSDWWASLIVQLVKSPPAMQETPVKLLGWKIPWRRDRLPTPVFLGFSCGSDG